MKLYNLNSLQLIRKSFMTALKCKTKGSVLVGSLALLFALYPAVLSKITEAFTSAIVLYAQHRINVWSVVTLLTILSGLSILNAVFSGIRSYYNYVDKQAINTYIRDTILSYSTRVEYNQLDNHDDFREKIEFASQYGGERVAGSIQKCLMWLQQVVTIISLTYIKASTGHPCVPCNHCNHSRLE